MLDNNRTAHPHASFLCGAPTAITESSFFPCTKPAPAPADSTLRCFSKHTHTGTPKTFLDRTDTREFPLLALLARRWLFFFLRAHFWKFLNFSQQKISVRQQVLMAFFFSKPAKNIAKNQKKLKKKL